MLASVGRSHHILSTCCESNALCVVVLVEASVTPRGVKLPEKSELYKRDTGWARHPKITLPHRPPGPLAAGGLAARRHRSAAGGGGGQRSRGGATDKHEALRGLLASLALPGGVEVPPRVPPDDH